MRGLIVAAAVLAGSVMPAGAGGWELVIDEDPMTDQRIATVAQVNEASEGPFMIGAKCWQGSEAETMLIVMMPVPFDAAASYRSDLPVTFRVDKGERVDLTMRPIEMGGRLAYVTKADRDPKVLDVIADAKGAARHVAIAVAGKVVTFPATGSTKAVSGFLDACGIAR